MYSFDDQKLMDRALTFLSDGLKSSRNPKPAFLHSVRTAMALYGMEYPVRTVIAGLLHDLIEDTNVTAEMIESEFGSRIAGLVIRLTMDETIAGYRVRYETNFKAMLDDKDALIIRCADLTDNSPYIKPEHANDNLLLFKQTVGNRLAAEPVWEPFVRACAAAGSSGH